jgi:hypothetical protein
MSLPEQQHNESLLEAAALPAFSVFYPSLLAQTQFYYL